MGALASSSSRRCSCSARCCGPMPGSCEGPRVKRAGKWLALLLLVALAAAALYRFVLRDTVVEPGVERLQNSLRPASLIGEGPDAIGVAPNGIVLGPLAQPEDAELPRLPLLEPPP